MLTFDDIKTQIKNGNTQMMKFPFQQVISSKTINNCIERITEIRRHNDILAICPTPTGYSWLGVQVATLSLFPDCTFQIPQDYSNQTLSDIQLKKIADHVNELCFTQVIFSGYLPYFQKIIKVLNTKVKILYHGTLSELSSNALQRASFSDLIKAKNVNAIGCVHGGLAYTIAKVYGRKTYDIILPNREIKQDNNLKQDVNQIDIGVLVNTSFIKNIHNQSMAALMVENALLHTFRSDELDYLPQDRIKYYPLMSHQEFLQLLSQMTINLHVSMCESWGQVLAESISQGVPCITANTSAFFDYSESLKQALVVDRFDDSWYIYKKIESVLKDRECLSKECVEYAKLLNKLAEKKLNDFLEYNGSM